MKYIKFVCLSLLAMQMFAGTAFAKVTTNNALSGVRLGFAVDRGFGVVGSIKQFTLFIGNDGAAADYIIQKEPWHTSLKGQVYWYLGGGVYGDWNGNRGVRVPIGAEWHFIQKLDAYAQLNPYLRVNNHSQFGLDAAVGIRYRF